MTTRSRIKSTSSMKDILPGDASSSLTTVVPLREGFRCYRFGFCYHDIRAFTTSWLPLPIFVLYRILLFLYIFSWLIVLAVTRNFKWKFFIYLTTLTNILINVDLLVLTTLCIAYAVAYYCKRQMLESYYLPEKSHRYDRDGIPWYVKVAWFLHNSATTLALMVAIGYWSLIYRCPPLTAVPANASSPAPPQSSNNSCINAAGVHAHGIDALLLLIDIFLSRVPVQLSHFAYPCVFTFAYIVLTLIYWGGGGTNLEHQPYVYAVLDYGTKKSSTLYAVLMVVAPMAIYLVVYLLALVRDCLTRRMHWCFRDIGVSADGGGAEEVDAGVDPNVQVTKVEVTVV